VAAADPAPLHAGKDLGAVLGLPRKLRIKVEGNPDRFFKKVRADVAFVCTSSLLKDVKPQIAALVTHRINVLTTCEELAWPVPARAAAYRELDRLAKRKKVSVLATGVNPGFAMDVLALALTTPCARVRRISVTRVVDAAARKLPLQRRVGAGLNLGQFRRAVTEGSVRHVGLVESAHMIAGAFGWKLDRVDESRPSLLATSTPSTFASPPGPPPASSRRCAPTAGASSRSASTCRCTSAPKPLGTTCSWTETRPSTPRSRGGSTASSPPRPCSSTASRSCWPPGPAS
jgi:hypothetical protein